MASAWFVALALGVGCGWFASPTPDHPAFAFDVPDRGSDAWRASANGHLVHEIEGLVIDVRYGRPKVAGRTLWGGLVPWGEVWRLGADEATTIAFSGDVRIARAKVPAGVYTLFAIPYNHEWILVLNKKVPQWGAYDYDIGEDLMRISAKPEPAPHVEELTFEAVEDRLVMRWGELAVPLRVHPYGPAPAEEAAP